MCGGGLAYFFVLLCWRGSMSVIDRSRVLGFNAIGWGQDSLHGKETSNHALCYFVLLRIRDLLRLLLILVSMQSGILITNAYLHLPP